MEKASGEVGRGNASEVGVMKGFSFRRNRVPLVMLLCGLMLLASAERRLAYLDFNAVSDQHVRIENQDKLDGNEIINRLIVADDATEPSAPTTGDACRTAVIPAEWCAPSLIVVRLSESRAPPLAASQV